MTTLSPFDHLHLPFWAPHQLHPLQLHAINKTRNLLYYTVIKSHASNAACVRGAFVQVDKLKESDAAVVGVFKGKDSTEQAAFLKLADALRDDFAFGHTTDPKLAGKHSPHHKSLVISHKTAGGDTTLCRDVLSVSTGLLMLHQQGW